MVIDCDWKKNFINKYLLKYGVVIFSGILFKNQQNNTWWRALEPSQKCFHELNSVGKDNA